MGGRALCTSDEGSSGQRELAPRGRSPGHVIKGEREAEGEAREESGHSPWGTLEDHQKHVGFALSGILRRCGHRQARSCAHRGG